MEENYDKYTNLAWERIQRSIYYEHHLFTEENGNHFVEKEIYSHLMVDDFSLAQMLDL